MPGVKQSRTRCLILAATLFALAGCESGDLARFAPPGIVKYEDLAGDQPVNPAVAERIEERREEKGAGNFPRLAETPDRSDRPKKRPSAEVAAETTTLAAARDALARQAAADRAMAGEELERDLSAESEALKSRLESDNAAAARERRDPLTPPPQHDE